MPVFIYTIYTLVNLWILASHETHIQFQYCIYEDMATHEDDDLLIDFGDMMGTFIGVLNLSQLHKL